MKRIICVPPFLYSLLITNMPAEEANGIYGNILRASLEKAARDSNEDVRKYAKAALQMFKASKPSSSPKTPIERGTEIKDELTLGDVINR